MKLNDFFDHIYCLNLDKRIDRWKVCEREFDRLGIEVERFTACDGEAVLQEIPDEKKQFITVKPGALGLNISHQSLLMDAMEKKYNSFLLFEDDIEFSPTFMEDFDRFSEEVPVNWEILYLGGNLDLWQPTRQFSEHVYNGDRILAAHAVGFQKRTFQRLYDSITVQEIVDVTLARTSNQYNSYIFMPRMAFQRPDFSDIEKGTVDYYFLKNSQWEHIAGKS